MRLILTSPEFLDDPERRRSKVKRPAVLLASLARVLDERRRRRGRVDTVCELGELGEAPYLGLAHPRAHPESSEFWSSPGNARHGR